MLKLLSLNEMTNSEQHLTKQKNKYNQMKKSFLILASYILISCGGSSESEDPIVTPPQSNDAPSVPTLKAPSDGLVCTDISLDFSWNSSSDPDGDGISYVIQVATNNSFSENLQTKSISGTTTTFNLLKGLAYYWRVSAKDSKNKSSNFSTMRKFYSEGEGVSNHLPYAATLISPVLNTVINTASTTLEWSSSDLDNDPLKYDIYLGETNTPALVLENSSSTTYDVNLDANTIYYWKVVVKDDAGGEAVGQLWTFSTN